MAERARRRKTWWSSVRARTTTAATVVVAIALTATGLIVLAALRDNLVDSADLQAGKTAADITAQMAAGTPLSQLRFPDPEDEPAQVVSAEGQVLAADDDLRSRGPMADFGRAPTAGEEAGEAESAASESDDDAGDDDAGDEKDDDEDEDEEEEEEDEQDGSSNSAGAAGSDAAIGTDGARTGPDGVTASTAEPEFGQAQIAVGDSDPAGYRIAALAATTSDGRPVTVYAGASLDTADSAVADVRRA
ncbi:MAG: two-component sensor histidine kinase, partial [Nocardia sp.]|nr:two-component sensor histidine kinase [Nocardia sp.]